MTSLQLFAWKKRLREAEAAQFVEVQVKASEHPCELTVGHGGRAIEVRLHRGRSGVVETGFDATHLCALLAVLEPEA